MTNVVAMIICKCDGKYLQIFLIIFNGIHVQFLITKKDASWVEIDKWVIFEMKIKILDNLAKLGNELMNELVRVLCKLLCKLAENANTGH